MKPVFLGSCLSLLPLLTLAQSPAFTRFGVTAGGTLTTRMGQGMASRPETQPLVGVVGGLVAQVPLGAKGQFFLQPELVYQQAGYRLSNPDTQYSATLRSSYVALPLLVGFTAAGFFVTAGPQLGYLVGVHKRYRFLNRSQTGMPAIPGETVNTSRQHSRLWVPSLAAAVGYRLPGGLGVEVGYSQALTSTETHSQPRHAGGQVRLSYLWR